MGEVSKKRQEARLRWYGQVMRSDEESDETRTMDVEIQGIRRTGGPKKIIRDMS